MGREVERYLDVDGLGVAVRAHERGGVQPHAHGAAPRGHHGHVHGGGVARQDVHEELVLAERRARVVRPHLHACKQTHPVSHHQPTEQIFNNHLSDGRSYSRVPCYKKFLIIYFLTFASDMQSFVSRS